MIYDIENIPIIRTASNILISIGFCFVLAFLLSNISNLTLRSIAKIQMQYLTDKQHNFIALFSFCFVMLLQQQH